MGKGFPFRFGLFCHNTTPSLEEMVKQASLAEQLGYNSFLLPDHIGDQFAPALALAHIARATTRLRIGSMVFNNDLRHPILLAKEAATLDQLSHGRLELGMGAGWMESEYRQLGRSFDSPRTRIERLAESIAVLKAFFSQEMLSFSGQHYALERVPCLPKPLQQPFPLFLGGSGKKMLSLAAREATCVGLVPRTHRAERAGHMNDVLDGEDASPEATHEKIAWIREAAGARFEQLELSIILMDVCVTEDRPRALQQYAHRLQLSPEQVERSPFLCIETISEIAHQVASLRSTYGISYIVVWDEHLRSFAPVVEQMTGAI